MMTNIVGGSTNGGRSGIVGEQRLQYDVWGDTVNVASRMESTREADRVHVSSNFAHALTGDSLGQERGNEAGAIGSKKDGTLRNGYKWEEFYTWKLVQRGTVEVKGKGKLTTFWLESTSNQLIPKPFTESF